uniref:Uncharacterized protein n=1 Tax=Micrurus paraensis TaxID=1970185 RepID=A0A2D4L3I7_9SAUR
MPTMALCRPTWPKQSFVLQAWATEEALPATPHMMAIPEGFPKRLAPAWVSPRVSGKDTEEEEVPLAFPREGWPFQRGPEESPPSTRSLRDLEEANVGSSGL